jgi:hypothetical protein
MGRRRRLGPLSSYRDQPSATFAIARSSIIATIARPGRRRRRGPRLRPAQRRQADTAVARFAQSGVPLGADQAAALRGVRGVESLIAAADTGKPFVVGAIADAWQHPPATPGGTKRP